MFSALFWMCVGGAIVFCFPGVGTFGNFWFKRLVAFLSETL